MASRKQVAAVIRKARDHELISCSVVAELLQALCTRWTPSEVLLTLEDAITAAVLARLAVQGPLIIARSRVTLSISRPFVTQNAPTPNASTFASVAGSLQRGRVRPPRPYHDFGVFENLYAEDKHTALDELSMICPFSLAGEKCPLKRTGECDLISVCWRTENCTESKLRPHEHFASYVHIPPTCPAIKKREYCWDTDCLHGHEYEVRVQHMQRQKDHLAKKDQYVDKGFLSFIEDAAKNASNVEF